MDIEEFSIIIFCWHDVQTDATKLRVVSVNTGEAVHLKDGSFLLRISVDRTASLLRCLIRHIASGSEAYVQSGLNLPSFVTEHLLKADASEPDTKEEQQ